MFNIITCAAVALMLTPIMATGQNLSAFEVLDACGRTEEAWISFCHGYMQATFDLSEPVGFEICLPDGITRATLAQGVYEGLLSLNSQVDLSELDGARLSASIMSQKFSCE